MVKLVLTYGADITTARKQKQVAEIKTLKRLLGKIRDTKNIHETCKTADTAYYIRESYNSGKITSIGWMKIDWLENPR